MNPRATQLTVVGILALVLSAPAVGQVPSGGAAGDGPPRRADGRPDLSGVWMPPYVPDMTLNRRDQRGYAEAPFSPDDTPQARQAFAAKRNRAELPFTPQGLADWSAYDAASGDYTGSCFPFGLQRSVNAPYPLQIMQNDKYVAFLFEQNTWFHVVPFKDRHSDDPNPTWFGESIARWDGDTLVIDTVGFNGYTRLDTRGNPHSAKLHLVQTLTHTDAGHVKYTVTVEDPVYYSKPWTNERTFTLTNGDLLEYSCEENNRSLWEGRIKLWVPPDSEPLRNPALGQK